MHRDELNNEYFEWLCRLVNDDQANGVYGSYRSMLMELHRIQFTYSNEMDANRAADGCELRYRFGCEVGIDPNYIREVLDYRPCSVLEMMVALSIKCEDNIMFDPDVGDRTDVWFWNMVANLHLDSMTDEHFNRRFVDDCIFRFLDHDYRRDGDGGLFMTSNPDVDMRALDIWYQMNTFLNEII